MSRDDVKGVTTTTELIEAHLKGQTKTHSVRDAAGRIFLDFTATVDAKEGDPCMVTEYVYYDPTSTQIIKQQERVYKWKAAWDTGFVFDPATDYDADGDGDL